MAVSLLRNGTRLAAMLERNMVLNSTKIDGAKTMSKICRCAPTVLPAVKDMQVAFYTKQTNPMDARRKLKPYSESESDSDWEVLGHRGESDFWRRKMRTFHSILDVNNDGVISYDDFRLLAERFINLGHLDASHSKEFQQVLKDLWERHWGEITPYNLVTVEQYLEDMHHVLNDKHQMKRSHSFLPYLFKALDKEHTGKITEEDFILFFNCLGKTEEDAIFSFRTIDTNGDGFLTLKEFVTHGREFFLTEDEGRISKFFWGPLVDH